jgi:hypothetical protein
MRQIDERYSERARPSLSVVFLGAYRPNSQDRQPEHQSSYKQRSHATAPHSSDLALIARRVIRNVGSRRGGGDYGN